MKAILEMIKGMIQMQNEVSETIDTRQPIETSDHIEIIEIDGKKIAVEYDVSIADVAVDGSSVGVSIGVENMRLYQVH